MRLDFDDYTNRTDAPEIALDWCIETYSDWDELDLDEQEERVALRLEDMWRSCGGDCEQD